MSSDKPDILLGIDTSGATFSIALAKCVEGTCSLIEVVEGEGHRAHEILAPTVSELIIRHALAPTEIVLGAGPGSFTGLRVGYAFAKGFAVGKSAALSSRCSLAAAAAAHLRADPSDAQVWLMVSNAGRGELFLSEGDFHGGAVSRSSEPEIVSLQGAVERAHRIRAQGGLLLSRGEMEELRGHPFIPCRGEAASGLFFVPTEGGGASPATTGSAIAELCPRYVRAVAAKSIAERGGRGVSKLG